MEMPRNCSSVSKYPTRHPPCRVCQRTLFTRRCRFDCPIPFPGNKIRRIYSIKRKYLPLTLTPSPRAFGGARETCVRCPAVMHRRSAFFQARETCDACPPVIVMDDQSETRAIFSMVIQGPWRRLGRVQGPLCKFCKVKGCRD